MTPDHPTPGSPLDAESVKLLKAGDVLRVRSYGDVERACILLDGPSADAGALRVREDGQSAPNVWNVYRFTFIGRPNAEGWMPWSGGENPFGPDCEALVECCFDDGSDDENEANIWDWNSEHSSIRRFRLAALPVSLKDGQGSFAGAHTHRTDGEVSPHPEASLSVSGVNLSGDRASIDAAKGWLQEAGQIETFWRPEVIRLTDALEAANANHEKFERLWYLAKDDVDRLKLAICGGEDVPGAIDAVTVGDCERFIRDERYQHIDTEARLDHARSSRNASRDSAQALYMALAEALEQVETYPLDDSVTCMCGSPVEGHNVGSGHAPVSQADHALSLIVEGIEKALGIAAIPDDCLADPTGVA